MRVRIIPLAVLGLLIAGCGSSGPKVVKVSGVATHNGQPVPRLRLTFTPESGRPSWGDTDENGRFTLEYDPQTKGAQVGKHTVSAMYRPTMDEEMGTAKTKPNPAIKPVTEKYGNTATSPMKVEITGSTDNLELKFD